MRDDWEKLSDEKSSFACMSSPYSKSFTSCELWVTNRSHVLLPLPLLFTPITSNSLQEDTLLPLIIWFYSSFFCASNVHTTSVVPCLSTSATLTRLGKRQFRIFGQLEYNYNTIFVYTIQYNTYLDNLECSNRMLVPELDLIIAAILKPSNWRHCDPEQCKKEMKLLKRA